MVLPIFVDEGTHIFRAERMLSTGRFLHETLAGKFLHIWLLMPFVHWTENPLLAARMLSVLTGLIAVIATFYLAQTLWPLRNLGWISALIYIVMPLPLINDRMALADSLLTTLTTLVLIFSIKLARQQKAVTGYTLGVCLGLTYLTKLNGLIYLAIPVFTFILLTNWQQSIRILIRPYLVALLIALPTIFEFPRQFLSVAVRGVPNPFEPHIPTVNWWLYSLGETWFDLITYVTWPILLLAVMHLIYGLRVGDRHIALLTILLIFTPAVYTLLGKDVWYSRYLLPIAPIIAALAARTLSDLAQLLAQRGFLKSSHLWLAILAFLTLLPSLIFGYRLLTNPISTPFTPVDRWQYITGWPSGYGIDESAAWLQQQATKEEPISVITDLHPGPTQEGLRYYLPDQPQNIILHSVDLRSGFDEKIRQLIQSQPETTFVLLNKPADQETEPLKSLCPTISAIFPKPENSSQLAFRYCPHLLID